VSLLCALTYPLWFAHSTFRVDQLKDRYHHYSYPHVVCSYCQSFDHDMNFCPYYDVSSESYGRLNAIIETINEQHKHCVSEMREWGLLHEIHPSLPSVYLRLVSMLIMSLPFL